MRVFVDTNIIIELLEGRTQAELVDFIFAYCEQNDFQMYLSTGSFYTIIYALERSLKKNGVHRPALIENMRLVLLKLLDVFEIVDLSNEDLKCSVKNLQMDDLEDSCQLSSAIKSNCDVLLTINIKDFSSYKGRTQVVTPSEFINKYLGN